MDAKQSGGDPFAAIEEIIPWDRFSESLAEAAHLARPEDFDYLALVGEGFSQLRRYTPSAGLVEDEGCTDGVCADGRRRNSEGHERIADAQATRRGPDLLCAPALGGAGADAGGAGPALLRLCILSELKNALRSGDVWVEGSRQFKDFEEYLLPAPHFAVLRDRRELGLAVETDCERFLEGRLAALDHELKAVERLAAANALPDAAITSTGRLKISPLDNAVPEAAETLMQQASSLLHHIKITDLLLEVDGWTGFTSHFKHLKSGAEVEEPHLLLTAILADAINLGLSKMAESCPGTSYARLTWLQAWHIRDETYSAALA